MDTSPIHRVPLFATLPAAELESLADELRQVSYDAGTILFYEGEHGDRFYIVLEGQIAIVKALGTADERLVALRGAGEFVGEMSLLSQEGLRTASALVRSPVQALELTRADFDALLHRYPTLAYEMLRVMSMRLRDSHDAAIRDLQEKNRRLAQAYADLQAAQAQIVEQETLARELRLAREIQESMLPTGLPRQAGFDIGARMVPARMVGGDFFDVIPLDRDTLAVIVGDVSGKGVPAALFMALASSLLRVEAGRSASPEQALRTLNQHLYSRNTRGMFVTVLYGLLRRSRCTFEFVRAGHERPLVLNADGADVSPAPGRGMPLGLFPYPILDTQTVHVPPGGTLLLYTDGVTEAMDAHNEPFGVERITAVVVGDATSSAQELCDQLVQSVTAYHGVAPQTDDITVLAVRAHRGENSCS